MNDVKSYKLCSYLTIYATPYSVVPSVHFSINAAVHTVLFFSVVLSSTLGFWQSGFLDFDTDGLEAESRGLEA